MKTFLRIAIIVVVIVLIGAGAYWLYQNMAVSQVAAQPDDFTQTVSVQEGDLDATISVVGELYAPQSDILKFDRINKATKLQILEVQAGHVVEADQILASIDPSSYQQALDQALSDLQEAEERVQDLQTPASELEIATADLSIARAALALRIAQDRLDDLLSPDIADLRVNVSEARLALAQAQEDLLSLEMDTDTTDRIYKQKEAEADRSAEYTRIANESYSDSYYQDRLRVAYEDLLDAEDTRIKTEIQQQINLLQAQVAVRRADWEFVDAQEALTVAEEGGDDLDLATARQAVAQAETDLAEAQDNRTELEAGAEEVDLASAQASVDRKRLDVSEAEADLAGTELLAPFVGTILETSVERGDRITANTTILEIANLDELQVVASVDETTIRQVDVGQSVQISFDAFPGQNFAGEVLSIPMQGTLQGGVRVYEVPISMQGAEALPLLVGMTANAEIQVGEVKNALLVPTMALQNFGGLYQVLVANSTEPEAEPEAVPVEIGLSNGIYTEIVRGLNLGDQVVVQIDDSNSTTGFEAMRQLKGGGGNSVGKKRPPGNRK